MFEQIPSNIVDVLDNNDLLIYSYVIRLSKHGPVLHIGAMFPYQKNRWEPLDAEENRDLRIDVKKELKRQGYQSKVRSFVHGTFKDINDFRLKILLKKGRDIEKEEVQRLKLIRRRTRKAKKEAEKRRRLGSQL